MFSCLREPLFYLWVCINCKCPVLTEQEADKEKHLSYLRSGPSLCLALQRENAVKKLLDLVGPEDPQSARRNSQFYWRGVFGVDPVCNGLYCKFSSIIIFYCISCTPDKEILDLTLG